MRHSHSRTSTIRAETEELGGCTGGGEPINPNANPNKVQVEIIPNLKLTNTYPFELAQDDFEHIAGAYAARSYWDTPSNFPTAVPTPGSRLPNGDIAVGMDFLHNSAQCPNCGTIINSAATWGDVTAIGLGVVGGAATGAIAVGAYSSGVTTLGIGTGFDAFGSQALNQLISTGERELLREFFKTGVLPRLLSARTLLIYAEIAHRAIEVGKDGLGVQAQRLQQIEEALRQLGQ
jgi:hypothetical protein